MSARKLLNYFSSCLRGNIRCFIKLPVAHDRPYKGMWIALLPTEVFDENHCFNLVQISAPEVQKKQRVFAQQHGKIFTSII